MSDKQLYEKRSKDYSKIYPLTYMRNILDENGNNNLVDIFKCYNHIYVTYANNVSSTRLLVPEFLRKYGLWISYEKDGKLYTEAFLGSNVDAKDEYKWIADSNWEYVPDLQYIESASSRIPKQAILPEHLSNSILEMISKAGAKITNLVDEEDLTEADCHVIKLKDRKYNKALASGLGHKILRKNWVNGKNILTQSMINDTNTIYEVRYDYDLNGQKITIPENCILDFQGGSFNNGTLTTTISDIRSASYNQIFFNIQFKGKYYNCYTSWLGDIVDNNNLCNFININVNNDITINYISNGDCNNTDLNIYGNNHIIDVNVKKIGTIYSYLFTNYKNLIVKDCNIICNLDYNFKEERKCLFYKGKGDNGSTYINNVNYKGDSIFYKYYLSKNIGNTIIDNSYFESSGDFILECLYRDYTNYKCIQNKFIISKCTFNCNLNENSYVGPISIQSSIKELEIIDSNFICNSNSNINGNNECYAINTTYKNCYFYNCGFNSANINYTDEETSINIIGCKLIGDNRGFHSSYKIYSYNNIYINGTEAKLNMQIDINEVININIFNSNFDSYTNRHYTYININNANNINSINIGNTIFNTNDIKISVKTQQDINIDSKLNIYNISFKGNNIFTSDYKYNTKIYDINSISNLNKTNIGFISNIGWIIANNKINFGTTVDRPNNIPIGFQYFDTTLNKPIWWTGTKWVDSVGSGV